jgi:hypothetical protein
MAIVNPQTDWAKAAQERSRLRDLVPPYRSSSVMAWFQRPTLIRTFSRMARIARVRLARPDADRPEATLLKAQAPSSFLESKEFGCRRAKRSAGRAL